MTMNRHTAHDSSSFPLLSCSLLLEPHEMNIHRHSFHEVFFSPSPAHRPGDIPVRVISGDKNRAHRRTSCNRTNRSAPARKGRQPPGARAHPPARHPHTAENARGKNAAKPRDKRTAARHPRIQGAGELTSPQAAPYTFHTRDKAAQTNRNRQAKTGKSIAAKTTAGSGKRTPAHRTRPGTHAP